MSLFSSKGSLFKCFILKFFMLGVVPNVLKEILRTFIVAAVHKHKSN